jgi:hypothetical protein
LNRSAYLFIWTLMLILLLFSAAGVRAQDEYAAVMHVVYAGVEMRRVNTERWITLTPGSEMPLGTGDVVRTDQYGRVYLSFLDGAETLILPDTTYEIDTFGRIDDETVAMQVRLQGRSVHFIPLTTGLDTFVLETDRGTVTAPAEHFAVQFEDDTLSVISAQGEATVTYDGGSITVMAGMGVLIGETLRGPIALPMPANFAMLVGELDGCSGIVQAVGSDTVTVRVGPGTGYGIGSGVRNGSEIPLLAIADTGERYRIAFPGGFGWVLASAVRTDCRDLPVLPFDTLEQLRVLLYPEPYELRLLEPFYSTPKENPLFYR